MYFTPVKPNTDLKFGNSFYFYTSKQEYVINFKTNIKFEKKHIISLNLELISQCHFFHFLYISFNNLKTPLAIKRQNRSFWLINSAS